LLRERSSKSNGKKRDATAAQSAARRGQRSNCARSAVRTQYAALYAHRHDPNFDSEL
jgi:hypothetical protein